MHRSGLKASAVALAFLAVGAGAATAIGEADSSAGRAPAMHPGQRVPDKVFAVAQAYDAQSRTQAGREQAFRRLVTRFSVLTSARARRGSSAHAAASAPAGSTAVSTVVPVQGVGAVRVTASSSEVCLDYALPSADAPQTSAGACNSNLGDVGVGGLFVPVAASDTTTGRPAVLELAPNGTKSVSLQTPAGTTSSATPGSDNVVLLADPGYAPGPAAEPAFRSLTVTSASGATDAW